MPNAPRLDIDPLKLDEEWLGQSSQMYQWSCIAADADVDYDQAKLTLKVIAAKLRTEAFNDPEGFGIPKATEAVVDAAVECHDLYKEASRKVIAAAHKSAIAHAAVDGLETRRKALESLVQLWIRQYYADPRPPKDYNGTEVVTDMEKNLLRGRAFRPKQETKHE